MKQLKYIFTFLGAFILAIHSFSQTEESIRAGLADPKTNVQQLNQDIQTFITNGGVLDDDLQKQINRHDAYYGSYLGSDGTVNNFYPDFLIQNNSTTQSLPNINNCGNPNAWEWESMGPLFVNHFTPPNTNNQQLIDRGNNGRLTSIEIDVVNNIVYAGSESGGLWKKTIGTTNWINITDKFGFPALGIQDIAINPGNPNEIYCATAYGGYSGMHGYGIGLIHTTDGGQNWERINVDNSPEYNHEALSVQYTDFPPYTVFAGVSNSLYRFNGSTWDVLFTTQSNPIQKELIRDIRFVAPQNGAPRKIFFSTHDVNSGTEARIMYHTLDTYNNLTWPNSWSTVPLIKSNTFTAKRIAIDISRSSNQRIIASYGSYPIIEVIASDNYGLTWTSVYHTNSAGTGYKMNFFRNDIAISNNSDDVFYNAAVKFLKTDISSPSAIKWTSVGTFHNDVRDIRIVTRGGTEEIWVAHDGGIHRSTDQGATWILENEGMQIGEYYDLGVSEGHTKIMAGALDNGNHFFDGDIWKGLVLGGDGSPALFFDSDDKYALIHVNGSVYNFNSQTQVPTPVTNLSSTGRVFMDVPIVKNPVNINKAFIGNTNIFEYDLSEHVSNGMNAYPGYPTIKQLSNSTVFPNEKISGITVSHSNDNIIYVSNVSEGHNNHSLFKTTTKGSPSASGWTDLSANLVIGSNQILNMDNGKQHITDVIVAPDNHNHVFLGISGITANGYKVVSSIDGGSTWADFTGTLPNVAIHELEIYDSSPYNILLAATDLGVYYRILDGPSNWQCYNNGLPPTIVKNFEIKYCSNELYVATIGHGIYKVGLGGMLPEKTVNSSTPVIWNTNQTIYQDVHIAQGSKLTINNATISMGGNAKIVVEAGGELVISNSTITSACDAFWGGIEVQSSNYNTQYCSPGSTCDVGKVTFSNSTIERSHFGVRNWNEEGIGSWGGIIIATNTHFLNNRKAVQFKYFENHVPGTNIVINNYSRFRECIFEINANYMFDVKEPQNAMVSLWEVRGITFQGCDFLNTSGQAINTVGINAVGASFQVKDYCPGIYPSCTPVNSSFSGLKYGIVNYGVGSRHSFLVDHANFSDNEYGVVCSGSNKDVITRNTFSPYLRSATNYDLLYLFPTAIFMQSADGYTIEENNITGIQPGVAVPGQPPIFSYSKGIVASRSGNGSNKIYKNTFVALDQANVAYGLNYNPVQNFEEFGLEYECNSMSSSINRDITIYGPNAGIATAQGGPNNAADNTFTSGISQLEGHIYNHSNQSQSLNYYYHANQTGYKFKPTSISSNVITTPVQYIFVESLDCKTHLNKFNQEFPGKLEGLDLDGKWLKASDGISGYNQAKYLYTALVDGGDTYGLLNTVQNNNSQTAWEVRTDLINSSPLSIEVINQTIDEEFLSNALLFDVLMVNPHGVRDEDVMDKLETKTTPMPAYMINTLLGIYEAQTQKDVLEAEMGNELQSAYEAARFLTLHWSADSLNPLNDSILVLDDTLNSPAADWASVAHYVATGNYTAAQSLISNMPVKFNLNEYEADEHAELDSYYTNYISMATAGNSSFENPTSGQLATLQQLAIDSTTKAGRMAQNLILFSEGKIFWPNLPSEPQNKKEGRDPRAKRIETIAPVATVYPNPANQYVTIEFTNIDANAPLQIKVINNVGVEMRSHRETLQNGGLINLVTENLASGQYFVLIYQNGTLLQKQAIEVVH